MIREVNPFDHLERIRPLLAANWQETGFGFALDLNVPLYRRLWEAGALLCLAAFVEDEVVGYTTAVLSPHPFSTSVVMCTVDVLYVAPTHRRGSLPGRLMLEMDKLGKAKGATHVLRLTRAGTDLHKVLARRGYAPADVSMIKEL